jgi:hypothetical protein
MKHPELINELPTRTKGRHKLGLFQCPFCPNTFISRIDQIYSEHTTSCGCRKKTNFKEKIRRQITGRMDRPTRMKFLGEYRQGGKTAVSDGQVRGLSA